MNIYSPELLKCYINIIRNVAAYCLLFVFFFINTNVKAQAELHSNTLKFAEEVFKECPEYINEELLKIYSLDISKVQIVNMKKSEMPELRKLSSFGLKNKCNASLTPEFNADDFNPLKYFLDFYSDSDQYIRVDNSNYVIFIKAIK